MRFKALDGQDFQRNCAILYREAEELLRSEGALLDPFTLDQRSSRCLFGGNVGHRILKGIHQNESAQS